jgi:hypothetical protein
MACTVATSTRSRVTVQQLTMTGCQQQQLVLLVVVQLVQGKGLGRQQRQCRQPCR